ncbi:hypothetical protein ScPMuIL_017751 [Solemya velum]
MFQVSTHYYRFAIDTVALTRDMRQSFPKYLHRHKIPSPKLGLLRLGGCFINTTTDSIYRWIDTEMNLVGEDENEMFRKCPEMFPRVYLDMQSEHN